MHVITNKCNYFLLQTLSAVNLFSHTEILPLLFMSFTTSFSEHMNKHSSDGTQEMQGSDYMWTDLLLKARLLVSTVSVELDSCCFHLDKKEGISVYLYVCVS